MSSRCSAASTSPRNTVSGRQIAPTAAAALTIAVSSPLPVSARRASPSCSSSRPATAGTWRIETSSASSSARVVQARTVPVVVVEAGGVRAANPVVLAGALPTAWATATDPLLAVVGEGVGRSLLVSAEPGRNTLLLNGRPYTVVAVVADRAEGAQLTSSVIVTRRGAEALGLGQALRTVLVRTEPGFGQSVAAFAPLAALPKDPAPVVAQVPPDPRQLRGLITTDTRHLLLALAIVTLLGGAVGIANTMLVSVWERRSEIGLRRALGASRRGVAGVFVVESALVGTAGGLVGAAGGILVGAGVVALRGWSFALPALSLGAPLLGTAVGVLAGLYPALRASALDPVDALRS